MHFALSRQQLAATALVGSGFTRWSRCRAGTDVAVLTFHGLRDPGDSGLLDSSLHEPITTFRSICAHLAAHYRVVTTEEAVAVASSSRMPPNSRPRVLLTFDDGYASNFRLALPILREFGLTATVFVSTAFIDGDLLWFQKLDLALARSRGERLTLRINGQIREWPLDSLPAKRATLTGLLTALKSLSWTELQAKTAKIVELLGADIQHARPEVLRALTWDDLRLLSQDGRIQVGGHTHRHPVLARCTDEEAQREIAQGAERLREELGQPARWFAYPNGGSNDFNAAKCAPWLNQSGFEAAFSMINGPLRLGCDRWSLQRYGAPSSVREAEATASGAFATVKQWRQHLSRRAAL